MVPDRLFVGVLIASLGVEISCQTVSVMLQNEVFDCLWQFGFFCHFQSVGDVAYHYRSALLRCEHVVRVHSALILGEEVRALDFTDVVIDSAHTHQLHVGTYQVSGFSAEVCHLHSMLESARAHIGELSQQWLIEVGEFHQRDR